MLLGWTFDELRDLARRNGRKRIYIDWHLIIYDRIENGLRSFIMLRDINESKTYIVSRSDTCVVRGSDKDDPEIVLISIGLKDNGEYVYLLNAEGSTRKIPI